MTSFEKLDKVDTFLWEVTKSLEWETLGGVIPDYAVTSYDGIFDYYLYTVTLHTVLTKDKVIESSKYSLEDAVEKALARYQK